MAGLQPNKNNSADLPVNQARLLIQTDRVVHSVNRLGERHEQTRKHDAYE